MAVTFPDLELLAVAYLQTALVGTAYAGTYVSVKHTGPEYGRPSAQVVVNASYGTEHEYVLKDATLVIDVYADEYQTANELALLVESLIRGFASGPVKRAEVVLGPVRRTDDSKQELRSLDVRLVVKGSN